LSGSPIQQASRKMAGSTTQEMSFAGGAAAGFDPETLNRFKQLTTPTGLTPIQKLVLREVQDNADIDTRSHVVSELMKEGIPQRDAELAIESLIKKGVISFDKQYQGEPVLRA
jgi:hypothetical protein